MSPLMTMAADSCFVANGLVALQVGAVLSMNITVFIVAHCDIHEQMGDAYRPEGDGNMA